MSLPFDLFLWKLSLNQKYHLLGYQLKMPWSKNLGNWLVSLGATAWFQLCRFCIVTPYLICKTFCVLAQKHSPFDFGSKKYMLIWTLLHKSCRSPIAEEIMATCRKYAFLWQKKMQYAGFPSLECSFHLQFDGRFFLQSETVTFVNFHYLFVLISNDEQHWNL